MALVRKHVRVQPLVFNLLISSTKEEYCEMWSSCANTLLLNFSLALVHKGGVVSDMALVHKRNIVQPLVLRQGRGGKLWQQKK